MGNSLGGISFLESAGTRDRITGEMRRAKVAVDQKFLPNAPVPALVGMRASEVQGVDVQTGMFDPPSGRDKLFWMTAAPSDATKMKAVIFFHHGFGDHSGFCAQELMMTLAAVYNFGVICCDMPGMGLFMYVPDFSQFVDQAVEFLEVWVPEQRKAWDAASGKQMKIFGCGESMGGGVLATIMLSKPDYYDGHILISPMLEIAEETRPHPAAEFVFKHAIAGIFPTLQIVPSKDIDYQCFTDPAAVRVGSGMPRHSGAAVLSTTVERWHHTTTDLTTPKGYKAWDIRSGLDNNNAASSLARENRKMMQCADVPCNKPDRYRITTADDG
eukprot:gene17868-33434_t